MKRLSASQIQEQKELNDWLSGETIEKIDFVYEKPKNKLASEGDFFMYIYLKRTRPGMQHLAKIPVRDTQSLGNPEEQMDRIVREAEEFEKHLTELNRQWRFPDVGLKLGTQVMWKFIQWLQRGETNAEKMGQVREEGSERL